MGKFVEYPAASEPEQVDHGGLGALGQTVPADRVRDGDREGNVGVDDLSTLDEDVGVGLPDFLSSCPALAQEVFRCSPGLGGHDDIHGALASGVLVVDCDVEDAGDGLADVDVGIPERH